MATVVNLRPADDGLAGPARVMARGLVREPELAELRAFCAALDLGSIGRAARLLHVSQPALSKRLHALEAVAGTKLLVRSTRGVTGTPAGSHLYGAARRLLAEADSIEALMRGFAVHPAPVRILASPTVAECWLPSVLVSLEARHERHLSVDLITANSTTIREMIRDGRGDIGLAAVDPGGPALPGLTETVVWSDEVVVGVPADHPWADQSEIDPEELARTPVICRDPGSNSSRVVETRLEAAGLVPVPPLAEIGSTAGARAAALAEGVPALLSLASLCDEPESGLVVRRVAGMRFERQFALILAGWLQDLAPSARALAQYLLSLRARTGAH